MNVATTNLFHNETTREDELIVADDIELSQSLSSRGLKKVNGTIQYPEYNVTAQEIARKNFIAAQLRMSNLTYVRNIGDDLATKMEAYTTAELIDMTGLPATELARVKKIARDVARNISRMEARRLRNVFTREPDEYDDEEEQEQPAYNNYVRPEEQDDEDSTTDHVLLSKNLQRANWTAEAIPASTVFYQGKVHDNGMINDKFRHLMALTNAMQRQEINHVSKHHDDLARWQMRTTNQDCDPYLLEDDSALFPPETPSPSGKPDENKKAQKKSAAADEQKKNDEGTSTIPPSLLQLYHVRSPPSLVLDEKNMTSRLRGHRKTAPDRREKTFKRKNLKMDVISQKFFDAFANFVKQKFRWADYESLVFPTLQYPHPGQITGSQYTRPNILQEYSLQWTWGYYESDEEVAESEWAMWKKMKSTTSTESSTTSTNGGPQEQAHLIKPPYAFPPPSNRRIFLQMQVLRYCQQVMPVKPLVFEADEETLTKSIEDEKVDNTSSPMRAATMAATASAPTFHNAFDLYSRPELLREEGNSQKRSEMMRREGVRKRNGMRIHEYLERVAEKNATVGPEIAPVYYYHDGLYTRYCLRVSPMASMAEELHAEKEEERRTWVKEDREKRRAENLKKYGWLASWFLDFFDRDELIASYDRKQRKARGTTRRTNHKETSSTAGSSSTTASGAGSPQNGQQGTKHNSPAARQNNKDKGSKQVAAPLSEKEKQRAEQDNKYRDSICNAPLGNDIDKDARVPARAPEQDRGYDNKPAKKQKAVVRNPFAAAAEKRKKKNKSKNARAGRAATKKESLDVAAVKQAVNQINEDEGKVTAKVGVRDPPALNQKSSGKVLEPQTKTSRDEAVVSTASSSSSSFRTSSVKNHEADFDFYIGRDPFEHYNSEQEDTAHFQPGDLILMENLPGSPQVLPVAGNFRQDRDVASEAAQNARQEAQSTGMLYAWLTRIAMANHKWYITDTGMEARMGDLKNLSDAAKLVFCAALLFLAFAYFYPEEEREAQQDLS
ncbi:unnamed protein product [Amoebophrya sp. A120]|nr:unnamed protein product [Amoebophrya sp. A120]|eukprot:GSA120T00009345001.1